MAKRLGGEPLHPHRDQRPVTRAQQTAEPLADLLARRGGPDPLVLPGLREQSFGLVDGLSVDEIKLQHPAAWNRWIGIRGRLRVRRRREQPRRFHTRVLAALRELVQAHPGQTLAVVTHGGVLDMVWRSARALALDGPRETHIPNGGLNHVQVEVAGRRAPPGHRAVGPTSPTWTACRRSRSTTRRAWRRSGSR